MAKRDESFSNDWVLIENQSLATAAREAGFDLAMYDQYRTQTKAELRTRTVKQALKNIQDAYWDETETDLSEIKYGVYVIRLSCPFTIKYGTEAVADNSNVYDSTSQIVYIGRGDVLGRLRSHLNSKLFDFMQSLSGTNFDFQILDPYSDHIAKNKLFKQIEHDLLEKFAASITGQPRGYPLLNKNKGDDLHVDNCGKYWDLPLRKRQERMIEWVLTPTQYWRHFTLKN